MLLKHFLEEISNLSTNKFTEVDVNEVCFNGYDISFTGGKWESIAKDLNEDIKINEKTIKELESEVEDLKNHISELEKRNQVIEEYFAGLRDNKSDTFKELFERNESNEKQIEIYKENIKKWNEKTLDLERENTKLKGRKNNAKIILTNPLIIEYQGIKYKTIKE
jgi:predicted nuclease with TOPRIM domain